MAVLGGQLPERVLYDDRRVAAHAHFQKHDAAAAMLVQEVIVAAGGGMPACILHKEARGGRKPRASAFLAESIGTSPVMVRMLMGMLKQAGIISSTKGKTGITLARPLQKITLLDLWRAVDQSDADSLFHFHESPCPQCPVGGNIHAALDGRLEAAQRTLENQLRRTTMADVEKDIRLLAAS